MSEMSWSFSDWTIRFAQFSGGGVLAFTVISRCRITVCLLQERAKRSKISAARGNVKSGRGSKPVASRVDDDALAVVEDDFVAAEDAVCQ